MRVKKEDNTIFVLQRAIRVFKIKVSDSTIREFLLTHPDYPTVKSVCDAFRKWRVNYYPLKLEPLEIKNLKIPFIAHLRVSGGQLAFVDKIENGYVFYNVYRGKSQKELFENFVNKFSGVVVLLEGGEYSGEKNYREKQQNKILTEAFLPLGIITVLLFLLYSLSPNSEDLGRQSGVLGWELLVTKIVGLFSCVFLVMKEFGIANPISDKICGFGFKTDCDAVLSSDSSRVFGWVNWTDVGIIYFTGTLIFFLGSGSKSSLVVLSLISVFSIFYTIFSLYYQLVKLKKWCPFCLIIQIVLVAEFVILFPILKEITFNGYSILRFLISLFAIAIGWLLFRAWYKESQELRQQQASYWRIKYNPTVFRVLLTQNDYIEFPQLANELEFGNPSGQVSVTAFLSLNCSPCAHAFRELKSLLDNSSEIKIKIVFSVYDDEDTLKMLNILYYLHQTEGSDASIGFLDQWYSSKKDSREIFFKSIILPKKIENPIQVGINDQMFKRYRVEGTPTIFVNGYKFPDIYKYSDLEYYFRGLKNINKEKKVDSNGFL